jgi:hypothetical protein
MKYKINIVKSDNEYNVKFTIGVQTFELFPSWKFKHQAKWMVGQLKIALDILRGE